MRLIRRIYPITLLVAIVLLGACSPSKKEEQKTEAKGIEFPNPPALITDPMDRADYILTHLFDGMTEIDTVLMGSADEREQFFANYFAINLNASEQARRETIRQFYQLATPAMDSIGMRLVSKYYGEPNSPFFDEASYLLMTEEAEKAGLLDEAEQIRLADRKALFLRNKVGEKAENFDYVLANGRETSLYNSISGLTLLLFYDPECDTCHSTLYALSKDPRVKEMVDNGLHILCIYAFGDEESWRHHLSELPPFATAGMDKKGVILSESLYDLKALPTIYLLDENCRVLMKDVILDDSVLNEIEEYICF